MRFENPLAGLYLIWAIPVIILFWIFATKKKLGAMNRFIGSSLWGEMAGAFSRRREYLRIIMLSLSVILLLIAFTRPQIGFKWKEQKREGLDIVFAIDVSRSMLAEDISPNRLERTKMAVGNIINRLSGDRIGLVAFAGQAFLQCPLTLDYDGFRVTLSDLSTDTIPLGGTVLSEAIRESVNAFEKGQVKYRVIILISDGEEHEGNAINSAKQAAESGIKIFCIGVGSPTGANLPITDKSGKREFIRDQYNKNVLSRLNEELLKEIAFATGGSYVRSSAIDFGLESIYNEKIAKLERREIKGTKTKQYNEHFQILLFLAIALLTVELFLSKKNLKP
jgi:Ca-activated chloride channel homolog